MNCSCYLKAKSYGPYTGHKKALNVEASPEKREHNIVSLCLHLRAREGI